MPRRKSKTHATSVTARERERTALELRKAGATYEQIGTKLGVSIGGAHKIVKRSLSRIKQKTDEAAEEIIRLEVERLDAMLLGLWERARRGEPEYVDRVLRIMKRRADLLGLDAPTKSQIDQTMTVIPHEDALAELEEE